MPSLAATLQFAVLLLPVALYSYEPTGAYRGLVFVVAAVVAARHLAGVLAAGGGAGAGGQHMRVTEWGQAGIKGRVQVRFPVEVRRVKRYIEAKQREAGGAPVTVLHVAMRALGLALQQIPEVRVRAH